MSSSLELVGINGSVAGRRLRLDPKEPLLIGRSRTGLHVADPLVSLEHAEISFATGRFWIRDLDSHTGTFLDGERLGGEPVALDAGAELLFGETAFVVEESAELPPYAIPALGLLGFVVAVMATLGWLATRPIDYAPSLVWSAPVRQGAVTSPVVALPLRFVRKTGRDHRSLVLRRVTDFDGDGIDEIWFGTPQREWVHTFEPDGSWRALGELPAGCMDRDGLTFPNLSCGPVSYKLIDGVYRVRSQDGVVAWLPPDPTAPRRAASADAVAPHRVSLVNPESLAGFLLARGVDRPVHYLLCEGALPGAAAQVLTADGELRRLDYGCIRGMTLGGPRKDELGRVVPAAVAFTAAGYEALLDDARRFLGGGLDGLFLDPADRRLLAGLATPPESLVGAVHLSFEARNVQGDPVAPEEPLGDEPRALFGSSATASVPTVTSATALTAGTFTLDPPGCSQLEIETRLWHCALTHWCSPGRAFLTIREVGCDPGGIVLEAPYQGGLFQGRSGDVEVRARVDVARAKGRLDVLKAQVAYRTVAAE